MSLILSLLAFTAVLTLLLDYRIAPSVKTLEEISAQTDLPSHQAPDFSFTDMRNRKASLMDFRGKIVILHFWASWCPPCVQEFPKLVTASKKFSPHLVLLALSSDDRPDAVARFIKTAASESARNDNIYMIWDKNRELTHDVFQTFAYPETIIIDAAGRMVRKIPGDADWNSPEMTSYLQSLTSPLADKAIKP